MTNTAVAPLERRLYQFDEFRVDPVRRLLLRDGEVVPITPKALSILLVLLERPGMVVEKNELIQRVWPDTFVTEANLTQNVSSLRKALGERANDRRYVVTVPSQGYAFAAEVREVPVEEAAAARETEHLTDVGPVRVSPPTVEMEVVPPVPLRPSPARPLRRRSWIALAGLALLVALAASGLFLQQPVKPAPPQREKPASASAPHRASYAVLGLRNLSVNQESGWLGPALTEMLTTELGAGSRVRVISGENVARVRQSAGLPYLAALEGANLGRIHSLLGADFVVVGAYISMSSGADRRLRLDLRVLKLPKGELAASVVQTGTETELFDLVSRAGAELRRDLGIGGLSPQQIREAGVLHPASPEAARLYTQGLARLRAFDWPEARQFLQEAAQADPRSAAIHSALSRVWSELGYDARAVEEARKAVELSGALSREERLAIQARLHEVRKEWSEASEIYRSLWTFFPDDIEYGLQLASALSYAGRGSEATTALRSLRRLPAPVGEDPRIDLTEARVAMRLSDVAAEKVAAAAVEKGRRSGQSLVVAEALLLQGLARIVKGEPEAAVGLFQEAKGLQEKAGYSWGVANALAHLGIAWQRMGDLDRAEKVYLEALAIAQQLGNVSDVAAQLGNLGKLYRDQGDLKRALDYLEKARAEFGEIEDPLLEARVLNASAGILTSQGDLTKAAQRYEEVIAISRKIGSASDEAKALNELGTVLAWKGNLGEAHRYQEKALEALRGQKYPSLSASILSSSTDVLARLGELATARQRNRQALTLRWEAGDRMVSGQILGWAARFAYRTGDLSLARRLAEEQLRLARETGGRAVEAWALQELGRLALAEGDLAAARRWVEQSQAVSGPSGDDMRSMAIRLQLSRLALAERKGVEAERLAREAATWYASRQISKGEALSLAVVAEALLLQGRPAEAQRAAARLRELMKGEDRELRVLVIPAVARAEAAAGRAEALRDLEREIAEAARIGLVTAGLEARLAQGEILLQQGDRTRGSQVLQGVRREAEAHKLGLFAKRAVEISRAPGALLAR